MEKKKPTKREIENKISKAIVFIPKDKETKRIRFDDKGLELVYTSDFAIVETTFHRHIFRSITTNGFSKPYLYIKRFVDIALEHDCRSKTKEGEYYNSYYKLLSDYKNDESKKDDYIILFYVDMYFLNIFSNLYTIGESDASSFMVYLEYIFNIAKAHIVAQEFKDDITNRKLVEMVVEKIFEYTKDDIERVIFKKQSEDEIIEQESSALEEMNPDATIDKESETDSKQSQQKKTTRKTTTKKAKKKEKDE